MTRPLTFLRPQSVAEAVDMLAEHGEDAKIVAGSTALTILLRQRLIEPAALVSIGRIQEPGLHEIAIDDGVLRLGALVTHRDVERSPIVREAIPVLAETFAKVANIRVRNAATVGGVVAEADYASDPPAVLLALDADIVATGPNGSRTIPASDFFLAFYSTALEPAEVVTEVRVPIPAPGTGAIYHKFVTRSSEDRPCVGAIGVVRLTADGTAEDVRAAVGAAAETPQRFPDLEAALVGKQLDDAALRTLADGYAERIDTLDDMRGSSWYRTEMVRVWVRRALESARDRAQEAGASPGSRA
jgi:carbon-monoxide dehydrogenase medium subunit